MPRVPVYQSQEQFRGNPVPVLRVRAPQIDTGPTLVMQGLQAAAQASGVYANIQEKARQENQKIEAAQVQEAQIALHKSEEEIRLGSTDPLTGQRTPGLAELKGLAAVGSDQIAESALKKRQAELLKSLPSADAQRAFLAYSNNTIEDARSWHAGNAFKQVQDYKNQQADEIQGVGIRVGNDPTVSHEMKISALDKGLSAIELQNQGQAPEVIEARKAAYQSRWAMGYLNSAPDYATKQAIMNQVGGKLIGDDAVKAREMLKVFGVKDKAQGFIDQLRAAHDLTTEVGQTEAQAKIDQIKETEVRDEAQQRLDARIGHDLRRRNAADAETVNSALGEIQGDEKRGIPPKAAKDVTGYSDMRPEIKAKVDDMARDYTNGKLVELDQAKVKFSDPKVHDELRDLANNKVDDFLKIKDWTRYRGALTEQDVRMYQSVQDGMRSSIAQEKSAEGKALKKMQIDQSQAYAKTALDALQKGLIPDADRKDKAAGAVAELQRGKLADAWQQKLSEHYERFHRPPTNMEIVSWKNQIGNKVSTLDAKGQSVEKNFWEMTGIDIDIGNQYSSLTEYQDVHGLTDNAMNQLRQQHPRMTDEQITQRLNDEAMGDYSASVEVPYRKSESFRDQARVIYTKEVERIKKIEYEKAAPERARDANYAKYQEAHRKAHSDPKYGMGGAQGSINPTRRPIEKGSWHNVNDKNDPANNP